MEIKDVQPNQGNIDLVLIIKDKGEARTFEKFGKTGKVCSATAKDDSGEIKLTFRDIGSGFAVFSFFQYCFCWYATK